MSTNVLYVKPDKKNLFCMPFFKAYINMQCPISQGDTSSSR